jgi:hypothetical protein
MNTQEIVPVESFEETPEMAVYGFYAGLLMEYGFDLVGGRLASMMPGTSSMARQVFGIGAAFDHPRKACEFLAPVLMDSGFNQEMASIRAYSHNAA